MMKRLGSRAFPWPPTKANDPSVAPNHLPRPVRKNPARLTAAPGKRENAMSDLASGGNNNQLQIFYRVRTICPHWIVVQQKDGQRRSIPIFIRRYFLVVTSSAHQ
jgi:hypothetical protein